MDVKCDPSEKKRFNSPSNSLPEIFSPALAAPSWRHKFSSLNRTRRHSRAWNWLSTILDKASWSAKSWMAVIWWAKDSPLRLEPSCDWQNWTAQDSRAGRSGIFPADSNGELTSAIVTMSGWTLSRAIMFRISMVPSHSRLFWQASAAALYDTADLSIRRRCMSARRRNAWRTCPRAAQALIAALHMISLGRSPCTSCILAAVPSAHRHCAAWRFSLTRLTIHFRFTPVLLSSPCPYHTTRYPLKKYHTFFSEPGKPFHMRWLLHLQELDREECLQ